MCYCEKNHFHIPPLSLIQKNLIYRQNYFYKIIQERFNIQENKNGTPSSVEYFFKRLGGVVEHLCPAGIYLLKVNNRNTRKKCGICTKLTTMTPE